MDRIVEKDYGPVCLSGGSGLTGSCSPSLCALRVETQETPPAATAHCDQPAHVTSQKCDALLNGPVLFI